jgi:hypothetical protein
LGTVPTGGVAVAAVVIVVIVAVASTVASKMAVAAVGAVAWTAPIDAVNLKPMPNFQPC